MRWLGVDVGGPRKGFDVALIDDREVLELRSRLGTSDVVALIAAAQPAVVGIESPCACACAPDAETEAFGAIYVPRQGRSRGIQAGTAHL
jgi:hypothetical protein